MSSRYNNVSNLEETNNENNNSNNISNNLSINKIYKYVNNIKESGSINEMEIITLFNSLLDEIITLKKSEYNSIPKDILVAIIDKSSDFEDFKEKINKFNKIKSYNKNYGSKLQNYKKNVLKLNV